MNTNTRSKNSLNNIIVGLLNKVIVLLLTFVGRNIFIKYIGVEYLGINGLFTNILSMLSLADLGFGTAMNYSFYKPLAEGDTEKIGSLIYFYKRVYTVVAVGVAVLGVCLIPALKYIVKTENQIPNLTLYYCCFLANSVVSYLMIYKSALINADQKNYVVNRVAICVSIVKTVIQILIAWLLHNYLVYICVDIVATTLNNLVVSVIVTKEYPFLKNNQKMLSRTEKRDIFANLKAVFLYKISGTLLNSVDSILISLLLGTVVVGYYSNYQTIMNNINAIIIIVFGSVTASVGNLIQKGNSAERYQVFKVMQMVSFWLSGFVTICIFVLSGDFVELWLGADFKLDYWVTVAISFNLFFSTSMQPLWSFREATGLYKKTKYIMLLAAILNLVFSIILGKLLGLAGIIAATVLARLVTYFWYEPYLLFRKYFGETESQYYKSYIVNTILIVGCGVLANLVCDSFSANTWGIFLVKGIIVTCIANLIYLIFYHRTVEFKWLCNRLNELIIKKFI